MWCQENPPSGSLSTALFTRVRGIGILGSSLAGSWIRPRNTPARWPWAGPIHTRGGRYYLILDAYAGMWMLAADDAPPPRALYALLQPHPSMRPERRTMAITTVKNRVTTTTPIKSGIR
jgi:hypothetical protein